MGAIKITPADRWFSMCVRERAGWRCERCGRKYEPPTQALHCCHIFSRGNWSTRFDPSNAFSGCMGCHLITARDPADELYPLAKRIFGELEFDRVAHDKNMPANGIRKAVAAISRHYREEYARLVDLRSAGVLGRLAFVRWEP